jgi:HK97 family phage portal protein
MGLVDSLFGKRAIKKSGGNPQSPKYWVQKLFGATNNTAAGVRVDYETALTSTAIWRAVSLVAQTIGALPLHLYEREGEKTKSKAVNHKIYSVLHDEPNPEQSAIEFREMLQAHVLTWGRAHAEIEVKGDGSIRLWPLTPDRVEQVRTKERNSIMYKIQLPDGGQQLLSADQIFTIRGLGYGINKVYSIIDLFKESIGLTLAAEEFGARFFGNGAQMGGVLQHPGELGEEGFKLLKESMNERHGGLSNAHRLLILEDGMEYKEIAVPPDKAQFIETRKYQISDVARIIGVPPHKLAEMDKATFSNIEHQAIEFVQDTINPWCVRWEQALRRQLLSDNEKQRYFFKHNLAALVRGDFKTRMEGYSIARQNGWLSANDIRELEDMNPIDSGDIYLIPLNMVPADAPRNGPDSNNRQVRSKRSTAGREKIIGVYKPLIRNAVEEIIKRERADIMREAEKQFKKRNLQAMEEWLNDFYEKHKEFIYRKLAPVLFALAELITADAAEEVNAPAELTDRHEAFNEAYVQGYIGRHTARSSSRVKKALAEAEPIAALEAEFNQWEASRIDAIANEESIQAANAFAKTAFLIAGVTKLVWVANSNACEFCQSLDGKVVGINQNFAEAGSSVSSATGDSPPMMVSGNISHPPIHKGCRCSIRPQ